MSIRTAGIPIRDVAVTQIRSETATRRASAARERTRPTTVAALASFVLVTITLGIAIVGFGVSLVRLATGSMTPTYPADSVLIVRSVRAADVGVGDIVTVSRDGLVPITHRVVSVTPVGTAGGAELVLRGDANTADDPEPYQVARVGLVLAGIPLGGSVLAVLQSPVGLGVATVVVCGLLLWAWWPRRESGAHVLESS
jgi:signal peptidase